MRCASCGKPIIETAKQTRDQKLYRQSGVCDAVCAKAVLSTEQIIARTPDSRLKKTPILETPIPVQFRADTQTEPRALKAD